jgi:hypothetical protein
LAFGYRLQDTYEEKEGKTVGRFQVYDDYIEFCARAGHLPTNNAALGKIFKVGVDYDDVDVCSVDYDHFPRVP